MKSTVVRTLLLAALLNVPSFAEKQYDADWADLNRHEIPDWALDAKFGIYAHWGPYSVIGSWEDNPTVPQDGNYYTVGYRGIYSRNADDPRRVAFEKRYGSVKDGNGYRKVCEDFTAREFDPVQWAELVLESGAKYAGTCAVHHDGYLMWDSAITDHCAGKTGPKRDLIAELFAELEKRDIKTIASFHHARTYKFFSGWQKNFSKGTEYAGVDLLQPDAGDYYWFLGEEQQFAEKRLAITEEFINKYHPSVIWFDGGAKDNPTDILATFFNMGLRENIETCLHNKDRQFGDTMGVYSYERGYLRPPMLTHPWEDDATSSVSGSWCWWHGCTYKPASDLILRLCHLTANNGGLLLSLNPRADGSFDPEMVEQLKGIGKWLKQNGEAIHGSRPWKIQGEGHVDRTDLRYIWTEKMPHRYATPDVSRFDHTDVRFTTQGNTLYAIQLGIPSEGITRIKSLSFKNRVGSENRISAVELVGHGPVAFTRTDDALEVALPKQLPNDIALVFKISVKGQLERLLYQGKR
ncbi:alpha-L-fucosidase [Pontiella agarivorans]|uniref:alpha-L-fucosidase n=1 Tax=Pontiella agarivorans TaxID=3038953 RepID=A0ABU5MSA7_9BACT|nr:alpha-L-fucosidase [Pontiella agarivorans]MDZ8117002.1 alpha-L-fucosidase [Pontiella agarivorans]